MMKNCKEMCCKWCYKWTNRSLGLLILRIAVGGIFLSAGLQKWANIENTVGFFGQLGFAAPLAYIVATIEVVGGLMVILGIGTCISAALFLIVMLGAMYASRLGLANVSGAMKLLVFLNNNMLHISLAASSLAIIFSGPGKYSLVSKMKMDCGGADCDNCKVK